MLLALGPHHFDITHRAVVLGVVDPELAPGSDELLRDAEALVVAGAGALAVGRDTPAGDDALVLTVAALRARFGEPIVVRTSSADVVRACFAEGASAGHGDAAAIGPEYLAAVVDAGGAVVLANAGGSDDLGSITAVLEGGARAAETAGIPADRVVLDARLQRQQPQDRQLDVLRSHDHLARLGRPLLLSDPEGSPGPDAVRAVHAVGVIRGARLLRTRQVRAARRVAEVAARLIEAREGAGELREVS